MNLTYYNIDHDIEKPKPVEFCGIKKEYFSMHVRLLQVLRLFKSIKE
jgi:hypothetical protein